MKIVLNTPGLPETNSLHLSQSIILDYIFLLLLKYHTSIGIKTSD